MNHISRCASLSHGLWGGFLVSPGSGGNVANERELERNEEELKFGAVIARAPFSTFALPRQGSDFHESYRHKVYAEFAASVREHVDSRSAIMHGPSDGAQRDAGQRTEALGSRPKSGGPEHRSGAGGQEGGTGDGIVTAITEGELHDHRGDGEVGEDGEEEEDEEEEEEAFEEALAAALDARSAGFDSIVDDFDDECVSEPDGQDLSLGGEGAPEEEGQNSRSVVIDRVGCGSRSHGDGGRDSEGDPDSDGDGSCDDEPPFDLDAEIKKAKKRKLDADSR